MGGGRRTDPRRPLELPFKYCDTPELRVLDLSKDGIWCVPVLGRTSLSKARLMNFLGEHVHHECIEISYCQRGELAFESMGERYPFRPGMVFVSRPDEPHALCQFPRRMLMYWMFFRIPSKNFPLLSLPQKEARWLAGSLLNVGKRLFHGGDSVRTAFQKLFAAYDTFQRGTPQRAMRLRLAVMELLVALIDASSGSEPAPPSRRVEQVIEDIRANPVASFTIGDLVEKCSMSPSNVIANFKRQTGLPPLAFRNACRIELAKKELARGGRRTIATIAAMLGYSSAQNFATQFRLATKKTPRAWRDWR